MKKHLLQYLLIVTLLLTAFYSLPVLATEDTGEPAEKYSFAAFAKQIKVEPLLSYNPAEKFRLGMKTRIPVIPYIFWSTARAEYSFYSKHIDYGVRLIYNLSPEVDGLFSGRVVHLGWDDNIQSPGVFAGSNFWQQSKVGDAGVYLWDWQPGLGYMYSIDARILYHDRLPKTSHNGYQFEAGQELALYSSLMGSYKSSLGRLDVTYSIPTTISDYNYLKLDAAVRQKINLTPKDQLVLTTEAGYLQGTYPAQQQFFVGSSARAFTPHFGSKFGLLWNYNHITINRYPLLALDGYKSNAFQGDKLLLLKTEYRRYLAEHLLDVPVWDVDVVGKAYGIVGDAWSGKISDIQPKGAIGIGIDLVANPVQSRNAEELSFGLNLTQGFGEHAATTIGFEFGLLADLFFHPFSNGFTY